MSLILIVDDDEWNARLVARLLEGAGHKTLCAPDPRVALPLLRHEKPALVLLDYHMPGMDGLELLSAIRKESEVPVIMLTAADRSDLAVRALRLGAYDYLTKPVDEKRLLETVPQAIESGTGVAGGPERIGPYEIHDELGRGGMGVVYAGRDVRLERPVAIKVLLPELAADPEYEACFLREAKGAARFSHPNIVTVYDAGRHRGRLFMAMERVRGRTLHEIGEADPPLTLAEALDIALQAAAALAAVHGAGLVHRDLKPGNLMLGPDGTVKVLDFGLARPAPSGAPPDPAGPIIVSATLAYAPPELIRTGQTGIRGDIYALGVVLYELIVGSPAFRGNSEIELMMKVAEGHLQKPWSQLTGVPAGVVDLLRRMMALDPESRPETMRDVAAALRTLRAGV